MNNSDLNLDSYICHIPTVAAKVMDSHKTCGDENQILLEMASYINQLKNTDKHKQTQALYFRYIKTTYSVCSSH